MGRLRQSRCLILGLAALSSSFGASSTLAFVPTACSTERFRPIRKSHAMKSQKNNDSDEDSKYKESRDKRVQDLLEIERLAAENKPPKIFEAVSKTFWAILGLGLLMNIFGYGYIVDKGGIRIDTLENKQFQQELVRGASKTGR